MRVGIIKYHCSKCSKSIILQYHPDLRTGEENPMIERLMDSKLCLDCYTDKRVEELVECLVN
jgi:hypothetical protein